MALYNVRFKTLQNRTIKAVFTEDQQILTRTRIKFGFFFYIPVVTSIVVETRNQNTVLHRSEPKDIQINIDQLTVRISL